MTSDTQHSRVDPNDPAALADQLADALRAALTKGLKVRDDAGELVVTYGDTELVRVLPNGDIVYPKPPPFSSLMRHPGESQADTAKRVLGTEEATP